MLENVLDYDSIENIKTKKLTSTIYDFSVGTWNGMVETVKNNKNIIL